MSLYPNITGIGVDAYYNARDGWGDNTEIKGTMNSTYTNCYNRLSYLLDMCDIVALPTMAVKAVDGKGEEEVHIGYNADRNINSTGQSSWTIAL
ncbi:MAG: hypothetical protein ACI32Z_08805 [Clostridium sp.]